MLFEVVTDDVPDGLAVGRGSRAAKENVVAQLSYLIRGTVRDVRSRRNPAEM